MNKGDPAAHDTTVSFQACALTLKTFPWHARAGTVVARDAAYLIGPMAIWRLPLAAREKQTNLSAS